MPAAVIKRIRRIIFSRLVNSLGIVLREERGREIERETEGGNVREERKRIKRINEGPLCVIIEEILWARHPGHPLCV